jgi:hypothetical protein
MKDTLKNWLCRSSQSSKIMTGTIPNKEDFNKKISELESERDTLVNVNGNRVKWTDNKKEELSKLIKKRDTPLFKLMPKTFTSELRKIYRQESHDRVFNFINKYTVKGIRQEEESITTYMMYLNSIGTRILFTKNEERFSNDFISGTPDLMPQVIDGKKVGFDVKSSWDLDTFPFKEDDLIDSYYWQNQCYMWLTDADEWRTAHCLVNLHEHGLNNEKNKYFYAYDIPQTPDDEYYDELIKQYRILERRYIFDYDRFVSVYPHHNMEISRQEWKDNNWDIPLEKRVIEKTVVRSEDSINKLKERIELGREYLIKLSEQ